MTANTIIEATGTTPQNKSPAHFFSPTLVLLLLGFYLLVIRPQQRRAQQSKQLNDQLNPGVEIETQAGLVGIISQITQNHVMLELTAGTVVSIRRSSISRILPHGSLKALLETKTMPST